MEKQLWTITKKMHNFVILMILVTSTLDKMIAMVTSEV